MKSINLYHPVTVLTHRGNLELKDVLPGDCVFEYGTNNLLKVIDITSPRHSSIFNMRYSDGRSQLISGCDDIYTGNGIVPANMRNECNLGEIKQYPVNFTIKANKMLDPIPYLAGAFLIYGDYNDEYLNLPFNLTGINNVFAYHYKVDYQSTPSNDPNKKVYFMYVSDHKYLKIRWDQIFVNNVIGATTKGESNVIIPDDYMRASIKDRIKLIRGIFDMGYNPNIFPDNKIGIVHSDENKLKVVQQILWSLGVLSKISYDPHICPDSDKEYKLEILGEYKGYPGFTYVLKHIEHLLDADNRIIDYQSEFSVTLKERNESNTIDSYYAIGYMSNLILEKPKALYLDNNYLPRVSV